VHAVVRRMIWVTSVVTAGPVKTASNAGGTVAVWSAQYVGPVASSASASAVLGVGHAVLRNKDGDPLATAQLASGAGESADAARWSLRLLTAPGYYQSHTAFSGNERLRRRQGPPVAILHPSEAERRSLRDGDAVERVDAQPVENSLAQQLEGEAVRMLESIAKVFGHGLNLEYKPIGGAGVRLEEFWQS